MITGRVINRTDKKPIANASIFLSGTTIGSETAEDGSFTLKKVGAGKFDIIVSVVGFETYSKTLIVDKDVIALPDIEMVARINVLKQVTIKYKTDPDRDRNLDVFRQQFLGTTEFAADCKLINPDVLDLDYNDTTHTLTASSYDFLKIENQALGYRLKYLIKDFSYDTKDGAHHVLHYDGSVLFEKLTGTALQQKRWERHRQEAYKGSEMHFLRALPNLKLNEEGFRVLQWSVVKNPARPADSLIEAKITLYKKLKEEKKKYGDSLAFWEKKSHLPKTINTLQNYPLDENEIVQLTDQKKIYALGCDMDKLHITYNKSRQFPKNGRIFNFDDPNNKEVTIVSFNSPYVFFDGSGTILNVFGMSISGAWAQSRVAGLLPYDYEPSAGQ